MGEDSGQVLLRMVRRHWIERSGEWMEDPQAFPIREAVPLALNFADPHAAQDVVDAWLVDQFKRARSQTALRHLYWLDRFLQVYVSRTDFMSTELGIFSAAVPPNYGHKKWDYPSFRGKVLPKILPADGGRLSVIEETGAGKTHMFLGFGEWALEKGRHLIVNFQPVQDRTGQYSDRIHCIRRGSDLLRVYAKTPVGSEFLFIMDEPEGGIKAGNSKGVNHWTTFTNFIRKFNMDVAEIWHDEKEQYRAGREAEGKKVYRIRKPERDTAVIEGKEVRYDVRGIPPHDFLDYDDGAVGTFLMDVNMGLLVDKLATAKDEAERKAMILECLEDPRYLLDEYVDHEDGPLGIRDVVAAILEHDEPQLNAHGNVDRDWVRHEFGLPVRDAGFAAKQATKALKERNGQEESEAVEAAE